MEGRPEQEQVEWHALQDGEAQRFAEHTMIVVDLVRKSAIIHNILVQPVAFYWKNDSNFLIN